LEGRLLIARGRISPRLVRKTGITDEMVAGHSIDDRAVNDLIGRVVLVIAHNASSDRRFLEKTASTGIVLTQLAQTQLPPEYNSTKFQYK
jgi:DNA polymerase III alpha subunit (gram-positive type)